MSDSENDTREFHVETSLQKIARQPGGLSRDQALQRASESIEAFKPTFSTWLDENLNALFDAIPNRNAVEFSKLKWLDTADRYSHHLADVSGTMDYHMVSLIANNLCAIFDAIRRGGQNYEDIIVCHIDALRLARRPEYRNLRPEEFSELSAGLRGLLELPRLQRQIDESWRTRKS